MGASTGPRLLDYLFSVRLTSGQSAAVATNTACGDQARQSSTNDRSRHTQKAPRYAR
jgi:hypothetical protein